MQKLLSDDLGAPPEAPKAEEFLEPSNENPEVVEEPKSTDQQTVHAKSPDVVPDEVQENVVEKQEIIEEIAEPESSYKELATKVLDLRVVQESKDHHAEQAQVSDVVSNEVLEEIQDEVSEPTAPTYEALAAEVLDLRVLQDSKENEVVLPSASVVEQVRKLLFVILIELSRVGWIGIMQFFDF